jgi:outer membrane protein
VVQDIILQVKAAYFTILKNEKIKAVALQTVEQVKSHVDVSLAFYEEEMIPKNDLLEAEVRYAQVQQDHIRVDNDVQIAKAHFNTILRRDINAPVEVVDILDYHAETFSLEACVKEALQRRTELKGALLDLEKAQQGVRLAKSKFFPTVSLVANYQRMGDQAELSGNTFEDAESWMVSTILSWDIWQWGKRHYQLGASKAKVAQAVEREKQVVDAVALEVKEAFLNLKEAEKNIFVAETAIEQAEENFRLNQERYNEQMATTTDVLDAQTLLNEAQKNYYNALSDYHIAKAFLERALGRE